MDNAIQNEICSAISARFGLPREQLTLDATIESLNIDSLSMIEFLFDMEDKWGISFENSRDALITIGDVCNEIDKAMGAAKSGGA